MTPDGRPVSVLRGLLRTASAWSPAVVASLVLAVGPDAPMRFIAHGGFSINAAPSIFPLRLTVIVVAALFAAIALVWAVRHPERGLQDRIAGTWLVPR